MDRLAPELPAALPPDSWRENVAAIVLDAAGRVLLGLGTGRNAYWHFPQGGVAAGESLEDALRRELQEEVALAPASCHIIAAYGGLRYRYRKNNDKHARWRGQQQTYMLVLCHGEMPPTDCSGTDEFCALTWVPWQELTPELFAPFKRKVVEKVLAHFFPPAAAPDPIAYARAQLTMQRYRCFAEPDIEADETTLFAGGKEEAALQLERLSLRLRAAQKRLAAGGERLIVLMMGTEGSGRRQALRRLAAALDPLLLHACREGDSFDAPQHIPWPLLEQLPPPGRLSLFLHNTANLSVPQGWRNVESWLAGQGVHVLKLSLYADGVPGMDYALQATTNTEASPWYAAPAGRRWYRDLVVFTLVAEAMERMAREPLPA